MVTDAQEPWEMSALFTHRKLRARRVTSLSGEGHGSSLPSPGSPWQWPRSACITRAEPYRGASGSCRGRSLRINKAFPSVHRKFCVKDINLCCFIAEN